MNVKPSRVEMLSFLKDQMVYRGRTLMMMLVVQLNKPVEMRLDALEEHLFSGQARKDWRRFPVPQSATRTIIPFVSRDTIRRSRVSSVEMVLQSSRVGSLVVRTRRLEETQVWAQGVQGFALSTHTEFHAREDSQVEEENRQLRRNYAYIVEGLERYEQLACVVSGPALFV